MVVAAALASAATYAVASATSPRDASASPARAESIKVHGRWTIKVVDGSGKLVTVRRFENSLFSWGGGTIARFLGRRAEAGLWTIQAADSTQTNPPCGGPSFPHCVVDETNDPSSPLTVTAPSQPFQAGPLTLNAHFTATRDGRIDTVSTYVAQCAYGTDTPCGGTGGFTGKTITPVNVAAGQQVLIRVDISFS
jgi:hypothetical protein